MSVHYESAPTNSSCLVTERHLTSPVAHTSTVKAAVYVASLSRNGFPPIDSRMFDYREKPDAPNCSSCQLSRVQCDSRSLLSRCHFPIQIFTNVVRKLEF